MKKPVLYFAILFSIVLLNSAGCKKNLTDPVEQFPPVDHLMLAQKFLAWSEHQPSPFVIAWKPDTTDGQVAEWGDLVTNIAFYANETRWEFRNSLFIDSTTLQFLKNHVSESRLRSLLDSVQTTLTEEQMTSLLAGLGLQMRMMNYDSLTFTLNERLLAWARHQYPPKTLRTTTYAIVAAGPNYGGYSPVWLTYRGTQNLQFFTRKVSTSVVNAISAGADTSLTFEQLQTLFSPVALLVQHNTGYVPE